VSARCRRATAPKEDAAAARHRAVAAIVLSLLIAGCGHSSSQRPAVRHYITQVNRIEVALNRPLASVTHAAANFTSGNQASGGALGNVAGLAQEQALIQASNRIRSLRMQLAGIPAPSPAGRLRALLLQLIDGQAAMTHEVAKLVVFLPRFQHTLLPLTAATYRLEAVLSRQSANGPAAVTALFAAKAAALRRFQAVIGDVAKQLRRLRPPAVSKPGYSAQLTALDGMGTSAGRLAGALASGSQSGLTPLLKQFDRAAASSQTLGVQRAEITAVRTYDGKIAALTQLSRSVERERQRLGNSLT
jgi:hypothetical protein